MESMQAHARPFASFFFFFESNIVTVSFISSRALFLYKGARLESARTSLPHSPHHASPSPPAGHCRPGHSGLGPDLRRTIRSHSDTATKKCTRRRERIARSNSTALLQQNARLWSRYGSCSTPYESQENINPTTIPVSTTELQRSQCLYSKPIERQGKGLYTTYSWIGSERQGLFGWNASVHERVANQGQNALGYSR